MSEKKIRLYESASIDVGNSTTIKIQETGLGFQIEIKSHDKDLWLGIPMKGGELIICIGTIS